MRPPVAAKMSERLITIADMLAGESFFTTVADVGCDHGYISIYLVQSGIADAAIAMDVRKGPLSGALSNVRDYGLEGRITTRLSDGLKELNKDEADGLVIAGMGGKLMIRILEDGKPLELGIRTAILQPQSELSEFRQYLRDKGYSILDERIVLEDGKYYFPMKVQIKGQGAVSESVFDDTVEELVRKTGCDNKVAHSICNRFGECNIKRKDVLLRRYLEHGIEVNTSILGSLDRDAHPERYHEVEIDNQENKTLLFYLTK